VVHHVGGPAAYADHPSVLDGDVAAAPVAAQHARRLHPAVDVALTQSFVEVQVDPGRPHRSLGVGCALTPDVCDAIRHDGSSACGCSVAGT